jgi:hypothetical protein
MVSFALVAFVLKDQAKFMPVYAEVHYIFFGAVAATIVMCKLAPKAKKKKAD